MPARFSLAQVETAKANLDALPAADKDTREVGLQGAIKALAPSIRKLASRGYSRQKIIELLREQGIPVSNSTLKVCLSERRTKRAQPETADTCGAGETAKVAVTKEANSGSEQKPAASSSIGRLSAPETVPSQVSTSASKSRTGPRS